jgi:predicted heme/steroid binding protein
MKRFPMKKLLMATALLAALALLAGCAPQTTSTPAATAPAETAAATAETTETPTQAPTATPEAITMKIFNAAELAKYDGKNGNPAYVAVDGKVYDVTDVPQWKDGSHFGRFQAGADLTEEIKTLSPHGVSKLDSVPIVGLYQP